MRVIRLLLALLVAVGLAFSPAAPALAMAAPSAMSDCANGDQMPDRSADHSKMDCCTAACQTPAGAALLPDRGTAGESLPVEGQILLQSTAKALLSVSRAALDPPPRLLLS